MLAKKQIAELEAQLEAERERHHKTRAGCIAGEESQLWLKQLQQYWLEEYERAAVEVAKTHPKLAAMMDLSMVCQ